MRPDKRGKETSFLFEVRQHIKPSHIYLHNFTIYIRFPTDHYSLAHFLKIRVKLRSNLKQNAVLCHLDYLTYANRRNQ